MLQRVLALSCMAVFYAVYFAKLLAQRRQGVRTNQMGKGRKPRRILWVERLLSAATLLAVAAELASVALGRPAGPVRFGAGLMLCLAGCGAFAAAVLGLGGSWRAGIPAGQATALVTGGVYSHSRNPAFLGFDLLYLGLALWFFNWPHLAFALFAVLMLHLQILQEEAWLAGAFGPEYAAYRARVRRYWGKKRQGQAAAPPL